ncbi:apolipoprotein A-II [Macrotis lagotis]|uniref:apolipoprotein A-II n=1 Tax=Macrotis lagotis TaxID=92651 RepID=UPI003D684756
MKLLTLTVLLLSICYLEGALVRRQTEDTENIFYQYLQKIADVGKGVVEKVQAPEVQSQVKAYFEKSQEQMIPLAKKAFTDTMSFFSSLVESGKKTAS